MLEVLGFLGAIISLIAAIVNRKTYAPSGNGFQAGSASSRREPVTIKKRLKRFFLAVGAMCLFSCAGGSLMEASGGKTMPTDLALANLFMWPAMIFMMVAVYQLAALVLTVFLRMWR